MLFHTKFKSFEFFESFNLDIKLLGMCLIFSRAHGVFSCESMALKSNISVSVFDDNDNVSNFILSFSYWSLLVESGWLATLKLQLVTRSENMDIMLSYGMVSVFRLDH